MTAPMRSWLAIRAEVERRVRNGDWPPGQTIPTEVSLAREFGCARATVNRALQSLAEDGVLERRRRAGTRVAPAPEKTARFSVSLVREEVERSGSSYGYRLLEQKQGPVDEMAARRMGLSPDKCCLYLRALHLADDRPFALEGRWINPAVVPGIGSVDFTRVSANEYLLRTVPLSTGMLDLSATEARGGSARDLGAAEGAALFRVQRTTFNDAVPVTTVTLLFAPGYRMSTTL